MTNYKNGEYMQILKLQKLGRSSNIYKGEIRKSSLSFYKTLLFTAIHLTQMLVNSIGSVFAVIFSGTD